MRGKLNNRRRTLYTTTHTYLQVRSTDVGQAWKMVEYVHNVHITTKPCMHACSSKERGNIIMHDKRFLQYVFSRE